MIVRFIASRMAGSGQNRLSKPIVVIATLGVAIGVALMILSVAIVTGFQQEVREKVIGFGAHYQISEANQYYSKESSRIERRQDFYTDLPKVEGIRHVQVFATKPGIIETDDNLQGCIIKGLGADFDWGFFADKITYGIPLNIGDTAASDEIMISNFTARRLELEPGDLVTLYFVLQDGDIRPRNFKVTTLYSTGLKEFDEQFVFVDIAHIQRINQWGIEAQLLVSDSCIGGYTGMEAFGYGGQKDLTYRWPGTQLEGRGPHIFNLRGDTTFTVIVEDGNRSFADTATAHIRFAHPDSIPCTYTVTITTSGGSWRHYVGGFEVLIDRYEDLTELDEEVFQRVPYYLQVLNVADRNPEIFSWLEMLDLNVELIIYMMILIAVVNMTSALLIIILERTNMIGLLKAFGMRDRDVVLIFVRHAARIIGWGMLFGNILGFGIAGLQKTFGLITLNPESYYVDYVPIRFDLLYIAKIEIITFFICVIFMLLPAMYTARIRPVKAIRFD
jgi:lipoprotein-releasing system permease protein